MSDVLPRVIFVNRVYWPSTAATAQLLADLTEGLAARDWPVHVIATGTEPGPRNGVIIHRTGAGEQHGGLLSRAFNYSRFNRRAIQLLAELARPGDVVVPLTDPPMLGAAGSRVRPSNGARASSTGSRIFIPRSSPRMSARRRRCRSGRCSGHATARGAPRTAA